MPAKDEQYNREQVTKIINSVIVQINGTHKIPRDVICDKLKSLQDAISDLRAELSEIQSGGPNQTDVPSAKNELDAVVEATEKAANTIMDACEKILACTTSNPEISRNAETQVVRIYEACTFQDIAGQRIKKVIKTLKKIDESVSSILGVLGGKSAPGSVKYVGNTAESMAFDNLMNGPQLPQNAMSQEEIDKLLASFD